MKPIPTRNRGLPRLLPALLALLAAAGCVDAGEQPLAPSAPSASEVASEESDFYYYDGRRIPLTLDAAQLSVESPLPPAAAARAALAALGVEVRGARPLDGAPGHWLLELAPGAGEGKARAAARALRADPRFPFAANVYRAPGGARLVLVNRVAVGLKSGWTQGDLARLNAEMGTRVARGPVDAEPDVVWLAYRRGGDPLELAARLYGHPLVAWADPDRVQEGRLNAIPTDPLFANQYYARNRVNFRNGIPVDVNAEWAWDLTYGAWAPSAGPFRVAVVDIGVQTWHPDLGSSWVGYDAVNATWDAWGCSDCASNPTTGPSSGHGTAVAGIIQAQHNNGIGAAGIAPAVQIMPVRIARERPDGTLQWATACNIGLAINNAWYNGAQVISNSWSAPASDCIRNAVNRATAEGRGGLGTVMVFSASNDSNRPGFVAPVAFPANLPNVLAVAALQRDGSVAWYSNGGPEIDVAALGGTAPTGDIVTTDLVGGSGYAGGDYASTFNGTSAAAPQAAAVAAMVLSRSAGLTEAQVRDRIRASADPWGLANDVGAGKLNAYRALVGRVGLSISGPAYPSPPNDYTWTANPSGGAGTYTYRWERQNSGSTSWYQVGTTRTLMQYVGYDAVFTLRATVTDGPDGQTVSRTITVRGPSSGGSSCSVSAAGAGETLGTGAKAKPARGVRLQLVPVQPACPVPYEP